MPASQLKRLKASLREQGIIGPQQSKRQKKKLSRDEQAKQDRRTKRSVALQGIREQFNPFDLKTTARGPKFDVTTNQPGNGATASILGRPGVSRAAAEEKVCSAQPIPPACLQLGFRAVLLTT